MKTVVLVSMLVVALTAAGCQKQQEPVKPQTPSAAMQPAVIPPAPQGPMAVTPGGNPHAGMTSQQLPAGDLRKGKVVQTMDASSYTYVEIDEKGQKLWLAVLKTTVKPGETVEFPDAPPMVNFTSKTLNRTFDKIIFAQGLRIVK